MTGATDNRATMFGRVEDRLRAGSTFVVTGHEMVDGDATGCEIALHHALTRLGKRVHVFNNEPLMERFSFLDPEGVCRIVEPKPLQSCLAAADAVIVVDNNSWQRLRALEEPIRRSGKPVICIDHHRVIEPFSELHLHDVRAAAAAEIVYDLLIALDADLSGRPAEAIYTAITSDTGWFRHSNTTARSFEICADLVARGVDPHRVSRCVNDRETMASRRLMGRIWETADLIEDEEVLVATLPLALAREHGAAPSEADVFIDELRTLRSVKMLVFVREMPDGKVKLSLRSSEPFVAHEIATAFGGGGHRHAAGATLAGPLSRARERVLEAVVAACSRWREG